MKKKVKKLRAGASYMPRTEEGSASLKMGVSKGGNSFDNINKVVGLGYSALSIGQSIDSANKLKKAKDAKVKTKTGSGPIPPPLETKVGSGPIPPPSNTGVLDINAPDNLPPTYTKSRSVVPPINIKKPGLRPGYNGGVRGAPIKEFKKGVAIYKKGATIKKKK